MVLLGRLLGNNGASCHVMRNLDALKDMPRIASYNIKDFPGAKPKVGPLASCNVELFLLFLATNFLKRIFVARKLVLFFNICLKGVCNGK